MSYPLAVITHGLGALSETFIRRHVKDLLPGRTAIVTAVVGDRPNEDWSAGAPLFNTRRPWPHRLAPRQLDTFAQRFAMSRFALPGLGRRFLAEHGVETVLAEYLDNSLPWLEITKPLGLRFFAHAHGYDVSNRLRDSEWRRRYLRYRAAAGLITMSEFSRKRLVSIGLPSELIHVVPYGVDVPVSPRVWVPREQVRCLAVGRMVPKKAPLLLIDAFVRAADACPNLQLDLVGEGELLGLAREAAGRSGFASRIRFHGAQPNWKVQELMSEADLFLQHSIVDPATGDEEGLPVAILEAMAHSLPVIATRHAGIPEAVVDETTGLLVREGDTRAMADAINALARDSSLRSRMGVAGWQRALDRFTWDRQRNDLLHILGLMRYEPPAGGHSSVEGD